MREDGVGNESAIGMVGSSGGEPLMPLTAAGTARRVEDILVAESRENWSNPGSILRGGGTPLVVRPA
jgi:hypothetical protein